MMDSNSYCDPCFEEGTPLPAIRFCSDCEERLCKVCVEYHRKFKATKSHHLMDLTSIVQSNIPRTKKFCEVHPYIPLDFYCTQHDIVCCRACIPSNHQSCKEILTLEAASKHIKQSSLFEDTLCEWQNIGKTLDYLQKDRNSNADELEKVESVLLEDIRKWKNELIEHINTSEEKLKTELSKAKKKNLDLLRKEQSEISELYGLSQKKEQELTFLKEDGSNNQLLLTLHEQGKGVQNVVLRIKEMILSYKKAVFEFEKVGDIDNNSIGKILERKEACDIQHSPVKSQQAQVEPERVNLPTLKKEITIELDKSNDDLLITDIAVTTDNKVFLCDFGNNARKVYVYNIKDDKLSYYATLSLQNTPYGISIITGTNKAVMTLPYTSHIQCVHTQNLKLGKTIEVGMGYYGIRTSEDFLVVGKAKEIKILKQNGEITKTIVFGDTVLLDVCSILYNHHDGKLISETGTGALYSIRWDRSISV